MKPETPTTQTPNPTFADLWAPIEKWCDQILEAAATAGPFTALSVSDYGAASTAHLYPFHQVALVFDAAGAAEDVGLPVATPKPEAGSLAALLDDLPGGPLDRFGIVPWQDIFGEAARLRIALPALYLWHREPWHKIFDGIGRHCTLSNTAASWRAALVGQSGFSSHPLPASQRMEDFLFYQDRVVDPLTVSESEKALGQVIGAGISLHDIGAYNVVKIDPGCRRNYTRHSDPLWQLRERARLAIGPYIALPGEVLDTLSDEGRACIPHFAVKDANKGLLAFTANDAAGFADRQAVIKPGRFIRRYARLPAEGEEPLSDNEIKRLAAVACSSASLEFKSSNQRADYARVYQAGPNSCMSFGERSSRGPFKGGAGSLRVDGVFVHPTEVYAHPDNDLMLFWGETDGGGVVVRVLANTRTKTYNRIYVADSPRGLLERMTAHLEAQGFKYSDEVVDGQKLLKIVSDTGQIICPFIDPSNVGVCDPDAYDDYLLAGGGFEADHSSGTLGGVSEDEDEESAWYCNRCNEGFEDGDDYELDPNDDRICPHCAGAHYTSAFCLSRERVIFVNDDDLDGVMELVGNFPTQHPLRHHDRVYVGNSRQLGRFGLVQLDTGYYNDDDDHPKVAFDDSCTELLEGDCVLTKDLDEHGLFVDEDNYARVIDDWAVTVDEDGDPQLIERDEVEDDEFVEAAVNHAAYPMLPLYLPRTEPQAQSEADTASAANL